MEKASTNRSSRRRIYLMRHAEVAYFSPEGRAYPPATVPLTEAGRRQAETAGRVLADVPLDRVVTSGLPRAVETAELVLAGRSLTLETCPELREIEPGRLRDLAGPGADPAAIHAAIDHAFRTAIAADITWQSRFLGGETFGELGTRAWPAFIRIAAEPGWRHLLIVAHTVVNLVLLGWMLGAGLHPLAGMDQEYGCINIVDVDDSGRFLIRLINGTPANWLKAGVEHNALELLYEQYLASRRP
jgi:probable phosphoglycerate mutase